MWTGLVRRTYLPGASSFHVGAGMDNTVLSAATFAVRSPVALPTAIVGQHLSSHSSRTPSMPKSRGDPYAD